MITFKHTRSGARRHFTLRTVPVVCCLGFAALLAGCPAMEDLVQQAQQQPAEAKLHISPARGSIMGGTRVTIHGAHTADFDTGTEVFFGAFLGSDVEIVDQVTLRVTAPAQAAGYVDVVVRVASGSTVAYAKGFEFVAMDAVDAEIIEQIEAIFPGPPHVVSALSLNNTGVRLTFSEPVREDSRDPANYSIVIPDGGMLILDRSKEIVLSDDHTVVDLPTLSQSDAFYRITVLGIHDLAGNPIAPPDMLVNPTEASFTGIAPADLDEHIDTDGDGFADWFEMLGWEITIELANGQPARGPGSAARALSGEFRRFSVARRRGPIDRQGSELGRALERARQDRP